MSESVTLRASVSERTRVNCCVDVSSFGVCSSANGNCGWTQFEGSSVVNFCCCPLIIRLCSLSSAFFEGIIMHPPPPIIISVLGHECISKHDLL